MSYMSTTGVELHRSENNNLTRVYLGTDVTLWFSYETIIAFAINGEGTFKVAKGRYSRTTDRHLNTIPAKETLPGPIFDERVKEVLRTLQVAFDNAKGDITSFDGVV